MSGMKKSSGPPFRMAAMLAILLLYSALLPGSDDQYRWEDDDHAYDRALRAVSAGETLPVSELLQRLEEQIPGEVVDIEFEREHGRWVYEFKVIDQAGRLLEVYMDAKSGEVLSAEHD